jgi:hypothetical protein
MRVARICGASLQARLANPKGSRHGNEIRAVTSDRWLFRCRPQLRRERAFGHDGEVTLYRVCADDEGMVFAGLALQSDQPRPGIGAVMRPALVRSAQDEC